MSEIEFKDDLHLAEWLGSLISNDEEWDAGQAAMWGLLAAKGYPQPSTRLIEAIEGECNGLSIDIEQAKKILHYVLQPLDYQD